jgi:hypothetical protein
MPTSLQISWTRLDLRSIRFRLDFLQWNLAAQSGKPMRALMRQVEEDHDLPLATDHVQCGLDRAMGGPFTA